MKNKFKQMVKLVEIETFSYCNRKCWHCPNIIIDRLSGNTYMSDFVYEKILKNLKQINYSGMISYSRYNEPLADSIIYKRLKQANQLCPNAVLSINTNGDFLNRESLKKLYDSGLRNLNIQVYAPNDKNIYDKICNKLISLDLIFLINHIHTSTKIGFSTNYKDMSIDIYYRDFKKTGVNRGGILNKLNKQPVRISPCKIPSQAVYIDYNGYVMPCCNVRSDWENHKELILGNLNDNNSNLFNIFFSNKGKEFRKDMKKWGTKKQPCNTCHFAEESSCIKQQ